MQVVDNWQQNLDKDMKEVLLASKTIIKNTGFNGDTAIILGSGLGGFINVLNRKIVLKYSEIPHYPEATVEGHSGELVVGLLDNQNIIVANGRMHMYEGYSLDEVIFPIKVFKECGIKNLIITNSAGSLIQSYKPGTIMIIDGHIDCTFKARFEKPKVIKNQDFHSLDLELIAKNVALERNINIVKGNYCWVIGPAYETSYEIEYFKSINGSAVGMSTLPEIREAGLNGMKLLTLSLLTNFAAGISETLLTHEDVLENAKKSAEKMIKLLYGIIREIKL